MKPLWDELADLADRLACAGQVALADLKTIRAAAIQMENWFEGNRDLRTENEAARAMVLQQDTALQVLGELFDESAKFCRKEMTLAGFSERVVDKAPFRNIMAAYGLDEVGVPLPAKRVRKVNRATT